MRSSVEEEHAHYHGVDRAQKHQSVRQALYRFLSKIEPVESERIPLSSSLHRILFEDIRSKVNIPRMARSTRDGFALRLEKGGDHNSSTFKIIGDVRIGIEPKFIVGPGEAARVATGSTVPEGANAILMKEYALVDHEMLCVSDSKKIEIGENILSAGGDIRKHSKVLEKGKAIYPQHFALLTQLGVKGVRVFRKPRIAFFSTGDELIDAKSERATKSNLKYKPRIYDSNRPFIGAMVRELNALPVDLGIARDNFEKIRSKVVMGLGYDALFVSAGSSVGERDYVSRAVESISGIRMLAHGVAMRPSSPTGLAIQNSKPLILLPGFPTSAIISFLVFGCPAIKKLSGSNESCFPIVKARMRDEYYGSTGLTHFLRVKVEKKPEGYIASTIRPSEAFYSAWMGIANGVAVLDERSGQVKRGDEVEVFLIRPT